MADFLTTGGILAAFLAGGVALFAPCCIVFLAPSYLAAAVKNRRWRLLPLTFLFAAGLAAVLLPITVGISLVSAAVAKYHTWLYYAGGILMLVLAAFTLSGRMWAMPSFLRAPDTTRGDGASFFSLGVFSGVASSCCAPVLVGVMTLSALGGSPVGGLLLGVAYVFGMVFPLFVMALLWDATGLRHRRLTARPVRLPLGRWAINTNTVNIVVAIGFAIMGVFVMYLANSGSMTSGPEVQVAIGRSLADWFAQLTTWLRPVPEPLLGLGLLLLAGIFILGSLAGGRRDRTGTTQPEPEPSLPATDAQHPTCH
ncbi:cytochrome c biogenesis CcdA family protein [Propioniciclava sinopodophylli]|uniref:cytochrome c biogenesis CcdA family protein n=1 Tax=Propioniciclava sinopodophylli TaxID=1837344 RepID=UPI00248F56FC|nr:cytochrome c biogenesis CcdA family protein [Propioniciclava sinopodophylli]